MDTSTAQAQAHPAGDGGAAKRETPETETRAVTADGRIDATAMVTTGGRQMPERWVQRSPRLPHAGLRGVMAGSPLPPLGLGVTGRTESRGRRILRRVRAHVQKHGEPHDSPAVPAPGRGADSRAGERSRRADGKQPKEATDRKRK